MEMRSSFLPLLGTWTGLEQQHASPGAPATTARALLVFRLDVDGTVVVQDYRQVRADGAERTAHGVFQGVGGADRVRWWLFDSAAVPPVVATGRWTDGELTLDQTTGEGTARHRFRATDDRLDYEMVRRPGDGAEWSSVLSGRYRRVSGH